MWGGILLGLFALACIGAASEPDDDSAGAIGAGLIMFALPGAALVVSGQNTQTKLERFASTFNSLSTNGAVSSLELQRKASISSAEIYKMKNLAEKRGLIPFGVEMK